MDNFFYAFLYSLGIILFTVIIVGIIVTHNNNYRKEHYKCQEGTVEMFSRDSGYFCAIEPIKVK